MQVTGRKGIGHVIGAGIKNKPPPTFASRGLLHKKNRTCVICVCVFSIACLLVTSVVPDHVNHLAVMELTTVVVPVCVLPRYSPCQAVVASVGAVVDDLRVYFEPFTIPLAVMSEHLLVMATGSWKVTRLLPDASASVL